MEVSPLAFMAVGLHLKHAVKLSEKSCGATEIHR